MALGLISMDDLPIPYAPIGAVFWIKSGLCGLSAAASGLEALGQGLHIQGRLSMTQGWLSLTFSKPAMTTPRTQG